MATGYRLAPPFGDLHAALSMALKSLHAYPAGDLEAIIDEVGFRCDCCARCCTREFNGHVLLLDGDVSRIRECEPDALEPVPFLDFCDQHGTYYTSGYTLRTQGDPAGSCHFLKDLRCRIYEARPAVCRVYPYMLHREPDERGTTDWRQISGLDQHGSYHHPVPGAEARECAIATKAFEEAVIRQEMAYLVTIAEYFSDHGLRNVRKRYDDGLRMAGQGGAFRVLVYSSGGFEPWVVTPGGAGRPPGPPPRRKEF